MGSDDNIERADEESSAARTLGAMRRRLGSVPRWAWISGGVALALVILAAAFDVATSSPRLCASCHEIVPRARSWERSEHAGVACVNCHQPPRAWYAYPLRLADRAALLNRDISKHLSGTYQDPVEIRDRDSEPIPDAACLSCHDPNRKATSGFRITIDHAAHARRNGSCVSCHIRTAHPLGTRGSALSFMAQCFTCHGTAKQPKASAECTVCHPADYPLVPSSHEATAWADRHGVVAKADLKLCEMCHEKATCDACHGVEMPHPMGWAKGERGHGAVAARDREVCEPCHGRQAYMCTMCHHDEFDPAKGTWIEQHPADVAKRGAAFCLECHSPTECVRCHQR